MRNYILTLFLLLVSCGQNNSNVRDLSTSSGLFNNNDIISNVDFVYLDASCMIGDIGRIRSFNEDFYIWDKQQKMIALFNKDGKYKDQLKRVGRGSQEYNDIADFDICQSSGNVYILCGPPKILIFDKDLNFEKEITLESFYNAIAVYKDGVLLYSGEKGVIDYISFVDNSTKRIAKFNTDAKYMDKNVPCFIRSSEGLYFQDVISDVIYLIEEFKAIPILEYDYPNRVKIQKEHRKKLLLSEERAKHSRPKVLCLFNIENSLAFVYNNKDYRINIEKNGKSYDYTLGLIGLDRNIAKIDNALVGCIYSHEYDSRYFAQKQLFDGIQINKIDVTERMRDEGNPILIRYSLKID